MNPLLIATAATFTVISSISADAADEPDLEMVQSCILPDLRGVSCVASSGDGRFVYAAAYQAGAVSIFKRDSETGHLTLADTLRGPDFTGAIRVRLSPDEKYAAIADFGSSAVTILKRDAVTGGLTMPAEISEGQNGASGLKTVIDANFSRDNRFLYTGSVGGVGVFRFEGDKLDFVQYEEADDNLKGVRACVVSPDGHWIYAVAHESGTLGVFRRDETTGKIETVQMLSNGQDGVGALRGAFRVVVSDNGKHVYVSTGRFDGDQAISAFEVQADGHLKLLQELVNGTGDFSEFEGGNEIRLSPDGKSVFAVASLSDRLFRFGRDPQSGKLAFISSQQAGTFAAPGAAGLCFSPDGKFAYVADEKENALEVFKLP